MAITGKVGISIQLTDTRAGDLESGGLKTAMAQAWTVSAGVGLNQADVLFSDTRTLASAATEDLDVSGTLSTLFGTTVYAKVKAIAIVAAAANTTVLTVSRPATNGLPLFGAVSASLAGLKPGGGFLFWDPSLAGIAVAAGTADLITITNAAGASATYTVLILGTSA